MLKERNGYGLNKDYKKIKTRDQVKVGFLL